MTILSINSPNPLAAVRAYRWGAKRAGLYRKYHAFWASHLQGLARAAHMKAQDHAGAAEDYYDAAASLYRRADYLEAVQAAKDALSVRDHFARLLCDASDELQACRREATAATLALSPGDVEDLGL